MATALRRNAAGRGGPPLLVVLDCKGGADARRIADRVRRGLRVAGARSTAIWPDEAGLSLWALPPAQLITTLADLIEHGTGSAAYSADVMEAGVGLAVRAPGQHRGLPRPAGLRLAHDRLRIRPSRCRAGAGPLGGPAARRHRAAVPHAVPPPGRRAGRARRVRRRRRLVLHPGGHRRDRGRRGPGPGAG